jgi:hypothetical protein
MFTAIYNKEIIFVETGGIAVFSLVLPLLNNSVIMKKSHVSLYGLKLTQNQFMTGFDGNPLKREKCFMMTASDL